MKKIKLIPALVITSILTFSCLTTGRAAIDNYRFDPYHINVTWHANHFGFSTPSGKFSKVKGELRFDEKNPIKSSVEVEIDANSIVTGVDKFDEHLRGKNFFDVEKYPTITFKSTKVELAGPKAAKVYGDLTMMGISKPIILNVVLNKIGRHPFYPFVGKTIGFSANTTINRSDFGMKYALPGVADEVKIDIEAEANIK